MDPWSQPRPPLPNSFPICLVLFHSSILGLPGGSDSKESACNVGDLGLIPGLRRSPGEGKGNPLQYSGLENSMDWIVHGVANSWTRLSNFHFILLFLLGLPPHLPETFTFSLKSSLQSHLCQFQLALLSEAFPDGLGGRWCPLH